MSQVIGLTAAVTILSAANAVAGMVGFSTFSAESYPLVAPSHFDVNWQVDGGDTPVTYAVNGQASVLRHLKPGWAAMAGAVDDGLAKPPFTRRHSPVQAWD